MGQRRDRSKRACVSPGNQCFAGGKSHLCSFTESEALLRAWASMEHSGLVKIYDLYRSRRCAAFIMEYLEGESLKEHILTTGEKKKNSGRKAAKWG